MTIKHNSDYHNLFNAKDASFMDECFQHGYDDLIKNRITDTVEWEACFKEAYNSGKEAAHQAIKKRKLQDLVTGINSDPPAYFKYLK